MPTNFTLRPLLPTDGPAIAALGEQTPETGAVAFHSEFQLDPYATLLALRPGTIGVVAEAPGSAGLAGLGLMSFGECTYEDVVRPFAYLYSLSVHPAHRRQGLATQIARWRVEAARARFGLDGVIWAGIQPGNEGSLHTARAWSQQRLDRGLTAVAKVRTAPPRTPSGWTVRPAREAELEQIASRQNAFYGGYNLYPPQSAESLAAWRAQVPFGSPLHDYFVLTDGTGTILAGLGITEEGRVMSSRLTHMAFPLRLANVLLRIVPPGGVVRRLAVESLWFAPDRPDAGSLLWESMRWLWRDRGTTMMTFFDAPSPLARAIPLPRMMPKQIGSLVVSGPVPMREDRLICLPV